MYIGLGIIRSSKRLSDFLQTSLSYSYRCLALFALVVVARQGIGTPVSQSTSHRSLQLQDVIFADSVELVHRTLFDEDRVGCPRQKSDLQAFLAAVVAISMYR